jgi:hypothetical protein
VASQWGVSPKESVLAEVRRVGLEEVVARCRDILSGRGVDDRFLFVLAGPASRQVLDGREGGRDGYWPRVWALRGLRYAYSDAAATSVIEATADRSWRVREMAAKIIGTHAIDDGLDALSRLVDDPVPRVRGAAAGARVALTNAAPASPRGYPAPRSNREQTDRRTAPTAHPSRRPGYP